MNFWLILMRDLKNSILGFVNWTKKKESKIEEADIVVRRFSQIAVLIFFYMDGSKKKSKIFYRRVVLNQNLSPIII